MSLGNANPTPTKQHLHSAADFSTLTRHKDHCFRLLLRNDFSHLLGTCEISRLGIRENHPEKQKHWHVTPGYPFSFTDAQVEAASKPGPSPMIKAPPRHASMNDEAFEVGNSETADELRCDSPPTPIGTKTSSKETSSQKELMWCKIYLFDSICVSLLWNTQTLMQECGQQ